MDNEALQKAVYIQNNLVKLERKKTKSGHRFIIGFELAGQMETEWVKDMNNLFDALFKNQVEYFSDITCRGLRLEWADHKNYADKTVEVKNEL